MPIARKKLVASFVGAPFAQGQNLTGPELGPWSLRLAGLAQNVEALGYTFRDQGDVEDPTASAEEKATIQRDVALYKQWFQLGMPGTLDEYLRAGALLRPAGSLESSETLTLRHVSSHATVDGTGINVKNSEVVGRALGMLHEQCYQAAMQSDILVTCGGDHAVASASISAVQRKHPDLCVIWIDAHGDCNTPTTSPSGHYHGMPAAHVMGWFGTKDLPGFEWFKSGCVPEERFSFIGLRDIDAEEGQVLQDSRVHIHTMDDVDRDGIGSCVEQALKSVDPEGTRPIHLSFDIDAIDPQYAPGTGTLARGGLNYRESHYICRALAATGRLVGMDIVEVNPRLDPKPELPPQGMHGDGDSIVTTPTVALATELVQSALGKTILGKTAFLTSRL